jgi:hypothetical protein
VVAEPADKREKPLNATDDARQPVMKTAAQPFRWRLDGVVHSDLSFGEFTYIVGEGRAPEKSNVP